MTAEWLTGRFRAIVADSGLPKMTRRIYPTRFGQIHLRSNEGKGKGVPLVLLHMSPRSSAMWEMLQERLERPSHAPDRLGYGFSDAPPWALSLEQYARGLKATSIYWAYIRVPSRPSRLLISSVPRYDESSPLGCRYFRLRNSSASWRSTANSL